MEAAGPAPTVFSSPTVLLSFNLDQRRREALNALAGRYGLPSRAAVIREAGNLVLEAAAAGGVLIGHVRPLAARNNGEGVHFPEDQVPELDAAAAKLGVSRSAALRWACDALIDAHRRATANGATEASNGAT